MKKIYFAVWAAAICLSACSGSGDEETSPESCVGYPNYCGNDGRTLYVCESGAAWTAQPCAVGEYCVYAEGSASCRPLGSTAEPSSCDVGVSECFSQSMARRCNADGFWNYYVCDGLQTCQNGICEAVLTPDAPEKGGISQVCGADGKSIETTTADGKTTTASCLSLVGYETSCRTFANGLVGCEQPTACGGAFSEEGACAGTRRMYCNTDFITPRPEIEDCAISDRVCAVVADKAVCLSSCTASDDAAVSCTDDDLVSRCVTSEGGKNVTQSAPSLCIDENTSVTCAGGNTQTSSCADGESCLAQTGTCSKMCSKEQVGEGICDDSGNLFICRAVAERYAYVAVGRRECLDDTLVSCQKNDETQKYDIKSTNCLEYVHTDGTKYPSHCHNDYQYPDMDVCVPIAEGDPCGDITNAGRCDGNVLSYCIEVDNVLSTGACGSGTICSVYADFADCRTSCSNMGFATCRMDSSGMGYVVSLCAPDQNDETLSLIDGTAVCMGDILYSCDENGKTTTVDCTANGGVCEVSACVYPACSIDQAPQCTHEGTILSCQINAQGKVLGTSVQSVSCTPDGACSRCENGVVVSQ